ncbi:hypothetical protein AB3X96_39890 [Paraburkholderia sp. BR13439]|uniref:hypothetical protein n=1 Tax=Paraburkholderia TaxID=1822464 RepID=UPI0034CE098E
MKPVYRSTLPTIFDGEKFGIQNKAAQTNGSLPKEEGPSRPGGAAHFGLLEAFSERDKQGGGKVQQPRAPKVKLAAPARNVSLISDDDIHHLLPDAERAYKQARKYHGTCPSSAKSIKEYGFDVDRKSSGATDAYLRRYGEQSMPKKRLKRARQGHYLTGDKEVARQYAGANDGKKAIVRVLIPDASNFDMQPDPDSKSSGHAYRATKSIPPEYVLQSHRDYDFGYNAQVFQEALKNERVDVPEELAAWLLAQVQSDSEGDF